MSSRKERQIVNVPPNPEVVEQSKARVRIGRACDRCKIKKSKCDGNTPCSACVVSDSICEYSARRRREARDWYWRMHDVMDEALQKLYWACREGSGFPGAIPDESSGRVSTEEILRGLGLSPPAMERSGPVTTQSESALDGGHPPSQRSYQPPDIQPKIVPRPSISIPSSNDTPQSMLQDDQMVDGVDGADGVDDVEGVDGVDGVSESEEGDKRRPSMLRRPQPDGDSAGQGQSFSENLDGSIDPAILPDGDVGMMDLQSPMHPPMNSTQFDVDDRRGSTQSRLGPSMRDGMQSNVFGASGQQGWGGQTQDVDGETLPWPGNMAAVYNDQKEPGGGGGFNTQNQQGWSDHDAQNRDFRS